MLSTAQARAAARSARLAAAREYASEVVQNVELQDDLGLEDKILGSLSGIVMEAIDCVRAEQPFRSSSLSLLSLELLSYLRQPNKPMIVNFACAFTMLMSELEGADLTEKGGAEGTGGPRSYSNSIPDVPPEAATVERAVPATTFSTPSTSRQPRAQTPLHQQAQTIFPRETMSADPLKDVPLFKEEGVIPEQERLSVEPIDYDDHDNHFGQHSLDGEGFMDEGRSESSYPDDASCQNELLQRMIANFSTPSTSSGHTHRFDRSDRAKNQHKNKSGRFESRDDQLAATYALPVSAKEIETLTEASMAELMRSGELSEMQRSIIRQIRKRARSKISSREYRKRKEARRLELESSLNSSRGQADQ